jgi:hypothetical protein
VHHAAADAQHDELALGRVWPIRQAHWPVTYLGVESHEIPNVSYGLLPHAVVHYLILYCFP